MSSFTSSSEFRKFSLLVAYFSGGFLIILLPLTIGLFKAGELRSYQSIVKTFNSERGVLVGLAYTNLNKFLKYHANEVRQPRVAAIGTSRVMQFRDIYFKEPTAFLNLGGVVSKVNHLKEFWSLSKNTRLKLVLLGLDQYFFNPAWTADGETLATEEYLREFSFVEEFMPTVLDFAEDLRQEKFSVGNLLSMYDNSLAVGLNARVNGSGFRFDGSYLYGPASRENKMLESDVAFKKTFSRISAASDRFREFRELSGEALRDLDVFLAALQRANVVVIGFFPPFAPTVYKEMLDSHKYPGLFSLGSAVRAVFEKHDMPFFDFTDARKWGLEDAEFFDGIHGSETAYARMIMSMAQEASALRTEIDLKALESLLSSPYNDKVLSSKSLMN